MSETDLQRTILEELSKAGYWAMRVNSGGRQGRVRLAPDGTPDICLIAPYGWIEVKLPGKGLRPAQADWHAKAQRLGVRVAIATSAAEAIDVAGEWSRQDSIRDGLVFELKRLVSGCG